MTNEAQTDQPATARTWATVQEETKRANGSPFYPLQDLPAGKQAILQVLGIELDPAQFQGKFSIFELEVEDRQGKAWRLCVSGTRLAAAISKLEPQLGDLLSLQPIGSPGMERSWMAERHLVARNGSLTGVTALAQS